MRLAIRATPQESPRGPPVESGLPAVPAAVLLRSQGDPVLRPCPGRGEDELTWKTRHEPVIGRMAGWVHLLPASREHPRSGAGAGANPEIAVHRKHRLEPYMSESHQYRQAAKPCKSLEGDPSIAPLNTREGEKTSFLLLAR